MVKGFEHGSSAELDLNHGRSKLSYRCEKPFQVDREFKRNHRCPFTSEPEKSSIGDSRSQIPIMVKLPAVPDSGMSNR